MSGTRKMEKFELDAVTEARANERREAETEPPPSSVKAEQDAKDAAAAIAGIDAVAALDALSPVAPVVANLGIAGAGADLPARPFEPRKNEDAAPIAGPADLPARPFEPRKNEDTAPVAGPADLPARPFEPRKSDDDGVDAATANATPAAAVATGAANVIVEGGGGVAAAADAGVGAFGEWVPPQAAEEAPPSSGAGATPEQLRTRLAQKFVSLADSVTEAFREFSIGAGAWGVELTAPQGMSTGGGKQALQHMRLRPRRGDGYSVLVAGTVNQVDRKAELRDYDHITIMHEVRYRHALEINSQEWEQFLRKAEVVLNAAGIQSMRTPPPHELLDQRRSMQRVSKGAVFALIVILILAAIVVWRVAIALSNG